MTIKACMKLQLPAIIKQSEKLDAISLPVWADVFCLVSEKMGVVSDYPYYWPM